MTLPALPLNDTAQPDTPKAASASLPPLDHIIPSIGATTEDISRDISFSTYSPDLDLTDPATGQVPIPLPTSTAIPSIRRSSVETPEVTDNGIPSSRRTALTNSVITVNTFSESDSFLDTPTSSSVHNSDHVLVTGRSPTSDNQGHGHFLLPIPTRPANGSRTSLTVADVIDDSVTDPLLPEIAAADIYVAPDGSFVETSSPMAARELKKRYDTHFGVSIEAPSPFALTSFVNQHGKQMIRLGHRQLSAPLASAPQTEERITQATASSSETSPRTKRRSRLSMHTFLPPTIFAKVPSSRPQTGTSQNGRKLRKTRSISDMISLSDSSLSPGTTGRVHSHSVTAADLPRYPSIHAQYQLTPTGDAFAEVMNWPSSTAASSPSTSYSTHSVLPVNGTAGSSKNSAQAIIAEPFGTGIKFETPAEKLNFLPTPRLLRGVQSFESGRTAKQDDKRDSVCLPSPPPTEGRASPAFSEPIDISDDFTDAYDELATVPSIHIDTTANTLESDLSPETLNFSHHTSEVFDILQKYRGLPLLDMLAADSKGTTVIKMSLSSENNVTPRDDPRFVIWGELQQPSWYFASSRDNVTDRSSLPSSTMSRRRSAKAAKGKSPERPVSMQLNTGTPRVLLAATIERWIAQLTSDLNYDELLDFFLTYRTYIDPMELCHFLICRFHWALKMLSSGQDNSVRRVVLVRTFVAIRYWLLTFFVVDFMPNRELRLFFAAWLNTLLRDPALKNHHEGFNMVQRLIKVAKDCKQVHTSLPAEPKPPRNKQPPEIQEDHVLGKKFAEATRKVPVEDNVSELDLDFLPEQVETSDANSDPANAHLNMAHVGSGISPTRPTSLPLSSFSILRRTEPSPIPLTTDNGIATLAGLSSSPQSNPISRAIVRTIGRIGRWRRVLNSRPVTRPPLALNACADLSAFDVDLTVGARDLLTVNGGVEQYLKMPPLPVAVTPMPPPPPPVPPIFPSPSPVPFEQDVAAPEVHILPPLPSSSSSDDTNHETEIINKETIVEVATLTTDNLESHDNEDPPSHLQPHGEEEIDEAKRLSHAESFRSSSTESFGALLTDDALRTFQPPVSRFDVVSIDDMEFSDTSSVVHVPTGDDEEEPAAPPGLRRPVRKLPTRRQFEFVRPETVSSMGIISRESIGSDPSSSSVTSLSIGNNLQPWQLAALAESFSNEEELGDVEAALRNLEGQINPEQQQARSLQVDGWVRGIQRRMAIGDYSYANAESDDEEEDGNENGNEEFDRRQSPFYEPSDSASLSDINVDDQDTLVTEEQPAAHTPQPSQTSHNIIPPSQESNLSPADGKPAREDVVPLEILQSRLPTSTSTSPTTTANPIIEIPVPLTSKFGDPEVPRIHRSFILNYRAEVLAKNFSVIDRELFIGVKFDELVVDDWMRCQEVNILDWAQFLKDRAQWKAESRFPEKTSALAAVRARFNLMVNFVISEIVLTHPVERHAVVAKFIRVAWKSYDFQNFTTLVAVVKALQSEWVNKSMGRPAWSRLGIFERRAFDDLKVFISSADDFKFIRRQIEAVIDAKQIDTTSHASVTSASGTVKSEHRPMAPPSCIPFIGIYLSRLYRLSQLPDLIDPTAPNKAVSIEPATANCDPPAHPEVFASLQPLPPFMHLEPLINVHKQRQIAAVIKSLVSGQHLAFDQHIELHDKKLFQKCLRLRGLDTPTLQRALSLYND